MKKILEDTKYSNSLAVEGDDGDNKQYGEEVVMLAFITKNISIISCLIDPMFAIP